MSLVSRIKKLENNIAPKKEKVYFMGWANCTWSKSEGLNRRKGESQEDFCKRVYIVSGKRILWFY